MTYITENNKPAVIASARFFELLCEKIDTLCEAHNIGEEDSGYEVIKQNLNAVRIDSAKYIKEEPIIGSPEDAVACIAHDLTGLDHEELWVMLLNNANKLIKLEMLYKGSVAAVSIRNAELFRAAVRENATSLILVHNHPSGNLIPSSDDRRTTESAVAAGNLLEIKVLDHIIIVSPTKFTSMKKTLPELF